MSGGVTADTYNGGESASASMSALNCYRRENISESVTALCKEVRRCIMQEVWQHCHYFISKQYKHYGHDK